MGSFAASTLVFYVGTVAMATAFVILGSLTFLPGGITGKVEQSELQRNLSASFFYVGALFYVDLAWHAAARNPLFDSGAIDWDVAILVLVQVAVALCAMYLIRQDKRRLKR